jgi:hypothetical protein
MKIMDFFRIEQTNKQTNKLHGDSKRFMAFSPQANYTDRTTNGNRRILGLTFADRGVSRGQRGDSPWPLMSVFYNGFQNGDRH